MDLERAIENDCVRLAQQCGWDHYKLDKKRNWPDQLFIGPDAEIFFVEFKRPGGSTHGGQQKRLDRLTALGFRAYLIKSREEFCLLFAQRLRSVDLSRYRESRTALEQRLGRRAARAHR